MGREIINQSKFYNQVTITSLCEKDGHKEIGQKFSGITLDDSINNLISKSEVIIDFTSPSATIQLIKEIDKSKKKPALVTGTTGYSPKEEKNFNLVSYSSEKVGDLSDIEIIETHHNKKKDVPSGTALSLAESVTTGNNKISKMAYREKNNNRPRKKNEIGFASIRGGDVIGEHSVNFYLDGERLELKHIASDRKIFSRGALEAAIWISKKKPGLYTLTDMLKN